MGGISEHSNEQPIAGPVARGIRIVKDMPQGDFRRLIEHFSRGLSIGRREIALLLGPRIISLYRTWCWLFKLLYVQILILLSTATVRGRVRVIVRGDGNSNRQGYHSYIAACFIIIICIHRALRPIVLSSI